MNKIKLRELCGESWQIFRKGMMKLMLMGLIVNVINALMGFIIYLASFVPLWIYIAIRSGPEIFQPELNPFSQEAIQRQAEMEKIVIEAVLSPFGITIGIITLILALAFSIIYLWLYAGQIMFALGVARGGNPSLSLIFKGGKYLWPLIYYYAYVTIIIMLLFVPIFLFTLLPGLLSVIVGSMSDPPDNFDIGLGMLLGSLGCFLFVFSIFYFQLIYGFGSFFIIDASEPVSPAMRSSRRNVHNNFWRLFLAGIVFGISGLLVAILPILGILVLPLFMIFQSLAYIRMSGCDIAIGNEISPSEPPL